MGHENRNWRRRWTMQDDRALHQTGLEVLRIREPTGAWGYKAANSDEVFRMLTEQGSSQPQERFTRLMDEARRLFERSDEG